MVTEVSNPIRPRARSHWGSKLLFGILVLVAVLIVLTVGTLLFGLHTGEEFSPDTFSRRDFYYFEIPLLGFQVTPIARDDQTGSFARYLRNNGFIAPAKPGNPRWDLVYAARSGKINFRGDADILCSYLDAMNEDGAAFWKIWSEENPKAAKVLWPLVARLARRQLYILTPELIDRARAESKPDRLQGILNESLARQFFCLGQTEQDLDNHESALDLLAEALIYAPDDPEIMRCRNTSRRALGHPEDALEDLPEDDGSR